MKIGILLLPASLRALCGEKGSMAKERERARVRREWLAARKEVRDHAVSTKFMFPGEILVLSFLIAVIGAILIWGAAHADTGALGWLATTSSRVLFAAGLALALMAYGKKRARLRIAMVKARTPNWKETNTRLVARERALFESLELAKTMASVKVAEKGVELDGDQSPSDSKKGHGMSNSHASLPRQTKARRL